MTQTSQGQWDGTINGASISVYAYSGCSDPLFTWAVTTDCATNGGIAVGVVGHTDCTGDSITVSTDQGELTIDITVNDSPCCQTTDGLCVGGTSATDGTCNPLP